MIRLSTVILMLTTGFFIVIYEVVRLTGVETTEIRKGLNLVFICMFFIGSIISYKLDKLLKNKQEK